MKLASSRRLNPSELTPEDYKDVERLLAEVFNKKPALLSAEGERLDLPEPVYHMLVQILQYVRERKMVSVIPEDEACTSQAAADFLGMSRPFLVNLLEEGTIPFHMVGSHRRVYFRDLLAYGSKRDAGRRVALETLTKEIVASGLDNEEDDDCEGR